MAKPTKREEFRDELLRTIAKARQMFEADGCSQSRAQYADDSIVSDPGVGAVYVFFTKSNEALYVGETGMRIRDREGKYPSPLRDAPWWTQWHRLHFFPNAHRGERELLEKFLLLSYRPKFLRHKSIDITTEWFT